MDGISLVGYSAAVLTALSSLPQVIKTVKTREAEDISLGFIIILISGLLLWLIYGIFKEDYPIIFCNILSLFGWGIVLFIKLKC